MKDRVSAEKTPVRGRLIYTLAFGLLKRLLKKPEISGKEKIGSDTYAIFIANHLGHFAPLNLFLFADIPFIPWIAHQVTDKRLCRDYLDADFTRPTLHIHPPFSKWISAIMATACVAVMNYLQAIPVYPKSKKILTTIDKSITVLKKGCSLLIFPEIAGEDKYALGQFRTGFVNLAKAFYEKTGNIVDFYPVCVNKAKKRIVFGEKIAFNPDNRFTEEKLRIVEALEKHISDGLIDG